MKKNLESLSVKCGYIIADLRKERRLTQNQLAHKLNISKSTLGHYEQGVSLSPPQILISMAEFFHVPIDYLLGRCTCKVEYTYLSNEFCNNMTYGDVINELVKLNKVDRKHLTYELRLMRLANNK